MGRLLVGNGRGSLAGRVALRCRSRQMNDRLRRLTRRREWKLLLDEAAADPTRGRKDDRLVTIACKMRRDGAREPLTVKARIDSSDSRQRGAHLVAPRSFFSRESYPSGTSQLFCRARGPDARKRPRERREAPSRGDLPWTRRTMGRRRSFLCRVGRLGRSHVEKASLALGTGGNVGAAPVGLECFYESFQS
jgi:hypothetical protein